MTKEQALEQLRDLETADTELAHSEADKILCELLRSFGCDDVVEAFDALDKWYA
jgi:hypothetical protein